MNFFTNVFDIFFPPRDTELIVRNTDYALLFSFLKPSIISIQHTQILTLLSYRLPLVQAFIIEAKFHNNKKAQKFLGNIIRDAIHNRNVTYIPLPLGLKREKERGYNQIEEILKFSELFFDSQLLFRARETAPQTSLGRKERLLNMIGAFAIRTSPNSETTYVLIDDVVTTGTTLLSAHETLIKAGAEDVFLLALAH